MARWSYLCSNFVFNYYKQRKRRSKVMEHMCFSASAASVYLHREWLLQPCLCYSVCIIALHLVLAAHTHTLSSTCLMRRCTNCSFGAEKILLKTALAHKKHGFASVPNTCSTALLIFLPYRLRAEFAFAPGSRPFLLLFQYVRALFEWGHPLPTWPGASSTSADLIESTTWVKFKQAETASPWQPHYSTLRTHSRMDCDSVPVNAEKGWNPISDCTFGRTTALLYVREREETQHACCFQ